MRDESTSIPQELGGEWMRYVLLIEPRYRRDDYSGLLACTAGAAGGAVVATARAEANAGRDNGPPRSTLGLRGAGQAATV